MRYLFLVLLAGCAAQPTAVEIAHNACAQNGYTPDSPRYGECMDYALRALPAVAARVQAEQQPRQPVTTECRERFGKVVCKTY